MTAKANFTTVKLSDICEFKYGQMPKKENLMSSGFPVFSGYGIVGYSNLHHFTEREIIVVARGEGGTGDVKLSPPMCFLTNLSIVVLTNRLKVDKMYLFYHLSSTKLWNLRTGSAQAQITISNLSEHTIKLPPLDVQKKIAAILSAYDDLIENNTRRIAILEENARLIYREWFVHFRFPGHEKVKLVDSPLGKIPQGWEVKSADEALEIDPKVKVPKDGEKAFVPMTSLSENSFLINDVQLREGNGGSKFTSNDILFARITPCLENGKTGFVKFLSENQVAFGSTEFIVLRSRDLCPEFVYLLARSDEFRNHAIKSMSGATGRQRVRSECFKSFYIAHPPRPIIESFHNSVSILFEESIILNKMNKNLRQTRDLLLPRLISGEIDVSKMEVEGM